MEIPVGLKTEKEIKLENGKIKISPDTFGVKVKLTAKQDGSTLELNAVDEKGNTAEIKKPIEVQIAFDGEVKNPDNVTAVLINEDGTEESVGGVYDEATKTIKFLTNKCGKFVVKEGSKEFKDTSDVEWAKSAIESMTVKGIIKGKTESEFVPSDNITRAEFAALVSRMLKLNENSNGDIPFADVDKDEWYYDSVSAVYQSGLINGKSDTSFDPKGNITREEMIKIIGNILKNKSYDNKDEKALDRFEDKDSIASWAKDSAAIAVQNGVVGGFDGNFMPKKNVTRAETAVMLYRLYELIMR
ncbi:S-layer homology domain-containing protein [Sporanaerobacter sp. PP17-6a]|uniref:S-layer homology domain-containing protein n=1 Tax=Sporanaerobacter sp. PP17-6a TaxID=1891289 RepID=UPI0008A058C9|nr:S-layer homology domain-containing protein [Sporanaerobacter sp. PP17-6a]SCL85891.1 Endo-1,4-beta-xylanase A precursor [Sporanaerobacter sp. PP17-6a]